MRKIKTLRSPLEEYYSIKFIFLFFVAKHAVRCRMTHAVLWAIVRRPFDHKQDGQRNNRLSELVLFVRVEVVSCSVVIQCESYPGRTIGVLSLRTSSLGF